MRNIGGSIGISVVEALLAENTQTVHSQLIQHIRPENPNMLARLHGLATSSGVTVLNAEVTRQAQMIAYLDDFYFMVVVIVLSLPFLLLLRRAKRATGGPAVAMD
ncbi:MAG: EmrB/QacA family drug resistance transporter, partial [Stellaceae bacterium]